MFTIAHKRNSKISHKSVVKLNETPRSFGFNVYVDGKSKILSFNALFSTQLPSNIVNIISTSNIAKPM